MPETIGLAIIILTAAIFTILGILYTRGKKFSLEDFISARSSTKLSISIATLVSSSMGAWILFSPAETTVRNGITALIGYALGSAAALWIFAWLGLKLRKMMPKGHTLTEYVLHRFGTGMYILVLVIIVFYMAVFLTAELTGISLAAKFVFGIPLIYTAFVVGIGTLTYTAFGGIKATIFTDRFQYFFILPLLVIAFLVSIILLDIGNIIDNSNKISPMLFDLGNINGIQTGITLIIAIVGANLFHQGYWQRVYIPKNGNIVKKSFLTSGFIVIPIILIVGSFGFLAVGTGTAENASVALFTFFQQIAPFWILIVMVLAVALVMSSMDTLLNGLVSLFAVDAIRLKPKIGQKRILSSAKWFTVILAGLAILVATRGFSVLYLFLLADLVCVAAAFPTYYGLFSKRFSGKFALTATIIGIISGAMFFPDPTFARGNLLYAFAIALIVPSILSLVFGRFGSEYDFGILKRKVVSLSK